MQSKKQFVDFEIVLSTKKPLPSLSGSLMSASPLGSFGTFGGASSNSISLKRNREVLSASIQKSMFEPVGGFSFELRNDTKINWEEVISNGDLASIFVDSKLKMTGIVTGVSYISALQGNKANTRVAVKVSDLGLLFTKYAKWISDPSWRLNGAMLGLRFQKAFMAITTQTNFSTYNIKNILRTTWSEMIEAMADTIISVTGRSTFTQRFGKALTHLFLCISNRFDSAYPLTLHILEQNYSNAWELWNKIVNPPLAELFCDSLYKGQRVLTFGTPGVVSMPSNSFGIVCRPSPWLGSNFDKAKLVANIIDPLHLMQVNASKSAAEVKSVYLVYPEGGQVSPTAFRANGDVAVDKNYMSTWGIDIQEVPLAFCAYDQDARQFATGLASLLQTAYSKIDEYFSGVALMRYWDVRIGQCICLPPKIGSKKAMYALAVQVSDSFEASDSSAKTQVTFVRGEITKALAKGDKTDALRRV